MLSLLSLWRAKPPWETCETEASIKHFENTEFSSVLACWWWEFRDAIVVRTVDGRRVSDYKSDLVELLRLIPNLCWERTWPGSQNSSPLVRKCAWPALSGRGQTDRQTERQTRIEGGWPAAQDLDHHTTRRITQAKTTHNQPCLPLPSSQITTTLASFLCSQPLWPRGREAFSETSHRRIFTRSSQPTLAITRFAQGSPRTQSSDHVSLAGAFIVSHVCRDLFDILGGITLSGPPFKSLHSLSPLAQAPQPIPRLSGGLLPSVLATWSCWLRRRTFFIRKPPRWLVVLFNTSWTTVECAGSARWPNSSTLVRKCPWPALLGRGQSDDDGADGNVVSKWPFGKRESREGEMERDDMRTANTGRHESTRCQNATQGKCVRKMCVRQVSVCTLPSYTL